ncbi:hypothetical protein [Uliginosibacterium sp. TH139]|uniref:hypothetical protein n=1 Tax=Uliginosibacterium sp. TH139 TaxID=2067453 RepID=UPI00117C2725|nr:hypothetical protein [Uliginosibacterium sp. TH139]
MVQVLVISNHSVEREPTSCACGFPSRLRRYGGPSRQTLDIMFPHGDDDRFSRSLPKWMVIGIFLPAFLSLLAIPFFGKYIPLEFIDIYVGLGVGGIGFSIVVLCVHGIRLGFLPGRFLVSRAITPIRFWLTILLLLAFALPMIIGACIGVCASLLAFANSAQSIHWPQKMSNHSVERDRPQAALVGSLRGFAATAAPHVKR